MNPEQRSVTAAWLVVFGALGVQNHWLTQVTGWLGAPPKASSSKSLVPGTNLATWQAGLIAYAILLVVAESADAGPLASIVSWGVALTEVLTTLPKLRQEYPSLFKGGTPSTAPQASSSSASTSAPSQPMPVFMSSTV